MEQMEQLPADFIALASDWDHAKRLRMAQQFRAFADHIDAPSVPLPDDDPLRN